MKNDQGDLGRWRNMLSSTKLTLPCGRVVCSQSSLPSVMFCRFSGKLNRDWNRIEFGIFNYVLFFLVDFAEMHRTHTTKCWWQAQPQVHCAYISACHAWLLLVNTSRFCCWKTRVTTCFSRWSFWMSVRSLWSFCRSFCSPFCMRPATRLHFWT